MAFSSSSRRQSRGGVEALLTLGHEHDLDPVLLCVGVPEAKLAVLALVELAGGDLEAYGLVGLGGDEQVLEVLVGLLDVLGEGVHDLPLGRRLGGGVGVLQLEEQTLLAGDGVAYLGDLVAGSANLDDVATGPEAGGGDTDGQAGGRVDVLLALLLLAGGAAGEVGLMLLALRVGEVGAVVLVNRQAETALEGADVVLEEVGVLVEVDGLERELAQAFAAVRVGR